MGQISLQRMLDTGDTLYAHCLNVRGQLHDPPFSKPPCSHGQTVDLGKLVAKLGDIVDLYSPDVQRLFKCKRCGARGASFISTPDPRFFSSAGRDELEAEERRKSEGKGSR